MVTTFNEPHFLEHVLCSLAKQTVRAAQIVVADDGSSPGCRDVVQRWSSHLPITLVWQPDNGFRASRIRNLAILKATGDHLIFIDGDCLVPDNFIESHQKLAQPGWVVTGGRQLLDKTRSSEILDAHDFSHTRKWLRGLKFLRLPLGFIRNLTPRQWRLVKTCNVGLLKSDLFAVGGFDERYRGWGREDSDLIVRLLHLGCRIRNGRFASCVLHFWHEKQSRAQLSSNEKIFNETLVDDTTVLAHKSVLRCLW